VAVALGQHPGVGGEDAVDDTPQVHVDDAIPVGLGQLGRRPSHRDAGVVEDEVEATVPVGDLVDEGGDGGCLGDVEPAPDDRAPSSGA